MITAKPDPSLPAVKSTLAPEKISALKNSTRHTKDSLHSFKDSIRTVLKSAFKKNRKARGEDSLNAVLDSFTDRDSLSCYLATHLGYDPESMHKDSL